MPILINLISFEIFFRPTIGYKTERSGNIILLLLWWYQSIYNKLSEELLCNKTGTVHEQIVA